MSTQTSNLVNEPVGYENDAFDIDVFGIIALLWRRRWLIGAFCAVGLITSVATTLFLANRYTSEAVVQARLARDPTELQSGIYLDAASVVQTEVNLIRTEQIAETVVTRLGLTNDPKFAANGSLVHRALALMKFGGPHPNLTTSSAIVSALLKDLVVTNDTRSLLIRISYTSTSPEQSARIANAFAEEYVRTRKEKAARQQLANLAATYGPKHPIFLRAQSQLEATSDVSQSAQILSWASPPIGPSGPNRRVIVAVAFLCSLAAGIVLVLVLERANIPRRRTRSKSQSAPSGYIR